MARLSATDALFHYADSQLAPMNMGSVQILRLPAGYKGDFFESYKRFVAKRLDRIPKLRMKLASNVVGLPQWVPCDDFDLAYHVRRTRVRSEDEAELYRKLGRLQQRLFDKNRPLCMFYVIEGLKDGRIAIMQKFHHALADGRTAVKIMQLFTDKGLERFGEPVPEDAPDAPGTLTGLLSGGLEDIRRTAASLTGVAAVAGRLLRKDGRRMLSRVVTRPVTIFNRPLSNRRLFAFRHWPLERLTATRRDAGLSFNGMGLAMLSGALRRYLDERDALPDKTLICNVPVAVETRGETSGNAVLAMWVPLGTDREDRWERIDLIKAEVAAGKKLITEVQESALAGPGVQLPSLTMRSLGFSMSSGLINKWMPPPGNVALSSVPVPSEPTTVAGARVEELYGMPMVLHGQAISVTYSTYEDKVVVGILCCAEALPDPERLIAYMEDELDAISRDLAARPRGKKARGASVSRRHP